VYLRTIIILYRVLLQRLKKKNISICNAQGSAGAGKTNDEESCAAYVLYINHATGLSQCSTHTYYYYYIHAYILVGEEIFFRSADRYTYICVAFMIYGGCFYHTVSGFVIKAGGVKWRWCWWRW